MQSHEYRNEPRQKQHFVTKLSNRVVAIDRARRQAPDQARWPVSRCSLRFRPVSRKLPHFFISTRPPQDVSPIMQQLSTYMGAASTRALPDEVIEKAKQHILDTFAAMISGSGLPPGRAALEFARAYGGKEIATVVASDIVCGPIEAAFANGVLAHSDETDDSHGPSRSHPGVSVVPAAFAAGEQFAITGAHFLRAVTLGYDVGTRITMSMGGPAYQAATHRSTHGTAAVFRRRCRRRLCRGSERRKNALTARLHGAANLRNRRLVSRCRTHGEGVSLRRETCGWRGHWRLP